jgi:hypothetical protein
MITNILLGSILVVLLFIALMIYAIGEKLSDKQK